MKYLLPKSYLSYSQLEMFRKSPDRYIEQYIENGKRLDTKYTRFGKQIHEALEQTEENREKEIRVTIHDVPVLSFIDKYDPETGVFRDTKTGKTPWTQVKVQKHDQLVFYAMVIKHSTGIVPPECFIDWIGTKDVEYKETLGLHNAHPGVELTGDAVTFRRVVSELEINRMEKELIEVAEKISNIYKTWINQNI